MPNPDTLVSPALVSSAQASGVVAAALHDTERAIDHSLIRIGALLQTLPEARLSAGLAACVGQRALEELGGVVTDCISARARLVRMHGRLTRDAAMLPLFAAASLREQQLVPETDEPEVELKPMTDGREVVEDYGHIGLTLRDHPLTFLREDLARQAYISCGEAGAARDMKFVRVAGIVLVRQKPGSAKGVMFITLEDETGIANLVIWPKLYEENRRTILGASMLGVHGRIQREGEVVHLVAYKLFDLSEQLASIGGRNAPFKLRTGRGDEFAHGGSPDQRDMPPKGMAPRDIYIPDLHIDSIKPKTRDFR